MTDNRQKNPNTQINSKNRQSTFFQTFDSSIIDKSEKFTLDKTLVKGIKQNDSAKIVENGEQADLGHSADLYNQQKQVNDTLVAMRKKYDQAKQNTNKIQQNLQRMKKQKQNLEIQKQKIDDLIKKQQNEFKNIENQLSKLNEICESAQYTRDIRIQISEVLKQDILFFKKNCFEANIKIVRNQNKLNTLLGQFEASKKISNNCQSLVLQIQKKINHKQTERLEKINIYHDVINKKIVNYEKRDQRSKMIQNSMLEALNGKMPEEQEQKKVFLVNVVLKKILKQKMQSQMEKFSQIQSSFRKIQQNTSVKKTDEFIDRFIKKEKNYGQLLEGISKSEQKIAQLKFEKQELEKQYQNIVYNKQSIEEIQQEKSFHYNKQKYISIDLLRQKLLKNENLKNKTFVFASKFLSAFDNKKIGDVRQKLSRQKPNMALKQVLQKLNKYTEFLQKQQIDSKLNQIYVESKKLNLSSETKSRNLRIKTLPSKDQTQRSLMEDHDVAYDDNSEREFLNQNRKHIKKSAYLRNRLKAKPC